MNNNSDSSPWWKFQVNPTFYDYFRCCCSEFLATFIFLFAVETAAINVARANFSETAIVVGGAVTGMAAVAVLAAFGDISGAHFNPAVTFGALLGGKIAPLKALAYVLTQLAASTAAAGLIYAAFPNTPGMVQSVTLSNGPGINYFNAVAAETIFTMIFLLVIYMVGLGMEEVPYLVRLCLPQQKHEGEFANEEMYSTKVTSHSSIRKSYYAIAAIGLTLGFLAMLGTQVSGGAFNPARVFGPELVTGDWGPVWIYWLGDLLGAALGTGIFFLFFSDKVFHPSDLRTSQ